MKFNGWVYRTFLSPKSGVVKVHLGPGRQKYLPGWINVDANFLTAKCDVWADLRNKLPFRNASVDVFYSHHVVEHLEDGLLRSHFSEIYRCLKPGGVFRIGGPNGDMAMRKYLSGDFGWFPDFPDARQSLGGRLANFILCRGEHLTILTPSYLEEIAKMAGFHNVSICKPISETNFPGQIDQGVLSTEWEPTPDAAHTLIVEAQKPVQGE